MAFSYVAAAVKTTNLKDLRHCKSESDLQNGNIRHRNQKFVFITLLLLLRSFTLFHISFSLLTLISIPLLV